jgi:hypothetical protein
VVHQVIDRVVDLRRPDTADWFAQTVSRAVLELHSPSKPPCYFRCWPQRRPLANFEQVLPAMLTQELGGFERAKVGRQRARTELRLASQLSIPQAVSDL